MLSRVVSSWVGNNAKVIYNKRHVVTDPRVHFSPMRKRIQIMQMVTIFNTSVLEDNEDNNNNNNSHTCIPLRPRKTQELKNPSATE